MRYREVILVQGIYEISKERKRIIFRKERNFKNYIKRVENKLSTSVEMQRSWNILQNLKAMEYKYKLPFNDQEQTAYFKHPVRTAQ